MAHCGSGETVLDLVVTHLDLVIIRLDSVMTHLDIDSSGLNTNLCNWTLTCLIVYLRIMLATFFIDTVCVLNEFINSKVCTLLQENIPKYPLRLRLMLEPFTTMKFDIYIYIYIILFFLPVKLNEL